MAAATVIPKVLNKTVILFPGQGSQYVGMCKNLSTKGKLLFDMANELFGYNLLKLCQLGPEVDLNRTVHAQPAVFVSSLAALENLAERSRNAVDKCAATAGFSLGEYCSLVLAQSLDFTDALKIIKLRSEVTQIISDSMPSGMMTVLHIPGAKIGQACTLAQEYCIRSGMNKDESICSIATHLFPHGKVIGGHEIALEFITKNHKDFGIRKFKKLAVSCAFHTHIMKPAAEDLKKVLESTKINDPKIPVYSNVSGKVYENADEIRTSLAKHVYKPVLWEQMTKNMYQSTKEEDAMPITFECGPSNTVTSLIVDMKAKKLAYNIEP